jgi:hypothetical protein
VISHDLPVAGRQRRLGWLAIGLAGIAFVLVAVIPIRGGSVPWIGWVLPLLIAANAGTSTFGLLRPWPRFARLFPFLSLAVALGILVAEVLSLIHP